MRLILNRFLVLLLIFSIQITFAQERIVSGIVSDYSGLPLPGVNVSIKETKTTTQTDFDGKYAIKAAAKQVLVFSYIGMEPQEVSATSTNVNIIMSNDSVQLEGVVITALGVKKEKKSLGYATSEIRSSAIEQRPDGDIARVMSGKSSGVNVISQNGMSGSGTNIVIRGYTSFSGGNQALFIVDGVPFSTETNTAGRKGERDDFINGNNGSSRFLDLDPNNIDNVTILKGLAAATLYGAAGRNGVILITTKSTSTKKTAKKSEITISSSLFINEIASLPDYQDQYGGGFDQSFSWAYSNWGPSFEKEGAAGWGNSSQFDSDGTVAHPYSTSSISGDFPELAGARYEYKTYNSVEDFFRKGIITNLSINMRGTSDDGNYSYNINYGHNDDEGFTPGNEVVRNNISMGGRAKFSNNLTINGALNYTKTDFKSPPVALSQGNSTVGSGSSIYGDLWFTPRNIDIQGLPYERADKGSAYYRQDNAIQHPLWTLNNAGTSQSTDRVFGNMALTYDIDSNLNILYRAGLDNYNESNVNYQNKGGVNGNGGGGTRTVSGFYETWNNVKTIWDHTLMLNGKYAFFDKLNFDFNTGGTSKSEVLETNGVASDGQETFGVLRHYNFKNYFPIEGYADRNIVGVFAQAQLEFNNYLYLTLSGRNDWVSDFAPANNSQFYQSGSVAFVPTNTFKNITSENGLNFLKLRVGIGSSSNFGDFGTYPVSQVSYLVTNDIQDDSGTNIVTNSIGQTLGNPNLKPELLTEYEIGMETKFFKNRFGIDLSLYKRTTKNLIVNRPLDPATGYTQTKTNIGQIDGKGIELDITGTIIQNSGNGFNWDANLNFTKNDTEVMDLGLDTDRVIYSGYTNLGNVAEVGSPLTSIYGSKILRDGNNNLVIDENGNYMTDPEDGIIGDANPDWVLNLGNSLTYKNFNFSFLINYTHGGDIYSSTISTLLGRGLIDETTDRERTFILPGVNQQGETNTVQLNNSDYYFNNIFSGPSELQIYDASTFRLTEVTFGYSLPSSFLENSLFSMVTFTLSGNNLYYRAINTPKGANFDPNTSGTGVGNGVGFDYLNGPSSRKYGFSVKVSF